MKRSALGIVAALAFCFPALASADFVYNIDFGYPTFLVTGTIATNCDNSCSLNSSNITAWSLSNPNPGSPISVASTDAGAQILGTPGDDMIATPRGIYFNFPDSSPRELYFSSVNGQVQLVTAGGNEAGYYTVCLPGNQICALGILEYSNLQLGTLESTAVPVPAAVWLLLSVLCGVGAFPPKRSAQPGEFVSEH